MTGIRASWLAVVVASVSLLGCRGDGDLFVSVVDGGFGFSGIGGGFGGFSGFSGFGGVGGIGGTGAIGFDGGGGIGGIGGNMDAGFDSGLPIDIWTPPFANIGAQGYGSSSYALCANVDVNSNAIDIWADSRGVFALVTGNYADPLDADAGQSCVAGQCIATRLFHHDRLGWYAQHTVLDDSIASSHNFALRGAEGGPIFATHQGGLASETLCGIRRFDADGTTRCDREDGEIVTPFVIHGTLAYAADTSNNRLLRWSGDAWVDLVELPPPLHIGLWAHEPAVLALNNLSNLARLDITPPWMWSVHATPPFAQASALWSDGTGKLWVGTNSGALWSFDGQAWQQLGSIGGTSCSNDARVRGIWGSGDNVYFYGARSLMQWNGSSLTNLATWSCASRFDSTTIVDMWGVDDANIFLALRDVTPNLDTCGGAIVVRFDGTEFHRM